MTLNPLASSQQRERERRAVERRLINPSALALFVPLRVVHCCDVRDITSEGICNRLRGFGALPIDFKVSFDNSKTVQKCRLVWRDGDFIGAAFVS
jgi:hypothetical protein